MQDKLLATDDELHYINNRIGPSPPQVDSDAEYHRRCIALAEAVEEEVATIESLRCGGCTALCSQLEPFAAALRSFVTNGALLCSLRDSGELLQCIFSAWRGLPVLPTVELREAVQQPSTLGDAVPHPPDLSGAHLLGIDTGTTIQDAAAIWDFICKEVSHYVSQLDTVQSRLIGCERRLTTCQRACMELRERSGPSLTEFETEVERLFEVRLQEELTSRFSVVLIDERVNFADFVNDLERGSAGRINAHLQTALSTLSAAQPSSSPLSPFAQEFTPSGAGAASAAVSLTVPGDHRGADVSDNAGNPAPLPVEVIGGGAELGSGLFPDDEEPHEEPSVSRLQELAGPRQRRVASPQEHDEDLPLDDDEARLLGLRPWGRG